MSDNTGSIFNGLQKAQPQKANEAQETQSSSILRLAFTNMPNGRPSKFTDETIEQAEEYINGGYVAAGDQIPSIVGLAIKLNVSRTTIYQWAEDHSEKFSYILEACNDRQLNKLINGGLSGELNATITKLVLGKHGYQENVKQENTGPGGGPQEHKWTVEFVNASQADKND